MLARMLLECLVKSLISYKQLYVVWDYPGSSVFIDFATRDRLLLESLVICVSSCSLILSLCPDTADAGSAMPMNNFNALCCPDGVALCTRFSWSVLGSSDCFCSD